MKLKSMIAALLLMAAGLQTAWAQGFRVYKSDGMVAQFSFRTDSIVFYDGIGTDEDFGPFTPVNQCIAGTWYESETETLTFNGDGTTDYVEGATYKFMPYRGTIIIYNADGVPTNILKVHDLTADQMILSVLGSEAFRVLSRTKPIKLVTRITLSPNELTMKRGTSADIIATALPVSASNREVTWRSSNPEIATVEASGRKATVTAVGEGSCVIICSATDGSGVYAECPVTVQDNHEYVDLGLPSGTLWATCNVGASYPEEYGDYFAWGETEPKEDYTLGNYKYCRGSCDTYTKYCTNSDYGYNGFIDNKMELELEDDAAVANWGSNWQMPSTEQQAELVNSSYTTTEWTMLNGIYGCKIKSKTNDKSIFLPAAGHTYDGTNEYIGSRGLYWSRSLYTGYEEYDALDLYFSSNFVRTDDCSNRWCAHSVRPVRKQ